MSTPVYQHVRCRMEDEVLILEPVERHLHSDTQAEELRREFLQALEQTGARRVVLDFRQVEMLSSAGFRPLLSLHRKLREQGGQLLFCQLNPQVQEVLRITRLISSSGGQPAPFDSVATLEEALARLRGGTPQDTPAS